jgi:hypothetical protein
MSVGMLIYIAFNCSSDGPESRCIMYLLNRLLFCLFIRCRLSACTGTQRPPGEAHGTSILEHHSRTMSEQNVP